MSLTSQTELIFLLLIFVVGFGALAKRLSLPYPIVLVIAGLLLSFVPEIPKVSLNPEFIFLIVLPPLLFSAAFGTSWRDFRYNFVSIFLLAFGLVGFTVFSIGGMAHMLLPGFDWRLGLVLGAVIATTDAIAATSIAERVGLPRRIIDVLEGESLINDASGLLALEFATALIVSNRTPSVGEGLGRLLWLIIGGIAVGLVVGKFVDLLERHLEDAPVEVTLSLVIPYAAYLAADAAHCSGVLAAVAAGFYLGNKSSYFFSSTVRIAAYGFWDTFTFVLNGVVFLLIGLQLPYILSQIRYVSLHELFIDAAQFVGAVIALRLIWAFPGTYTAFLIRRYVLKQPESLPSARGIFLVGWTGMRGVVALAAAISLPEKTANGQAFPQRNMIIFLTFCVIFITLVAQGLTLPSLIRALGLSVQATDDGEEKLARHKILQTALERLHKLRKDDAPNHAEVYDDIAHHYEDRLAALAQENGEADDPHQEHQERYRSISRELRRIERETAIQLRNRKEIGDNVLHALERELDLLDSRYSQV
ncbi:MAG: Na+/H+ antiporter [Bryobacteraceae bacterium]